VNKLTKFIVFILILFTFFILLNFLSVNNKSGPKDIEILSSSEGVPMFATGNCNTNLDCFPSGCANHICANHDVVTTCENIDFPEKVAHTCGCIDNKCVWFK